MSISGYDEFRLGDFGSFEDSIIGRIRLDRCDTTLGDDELERISEECRDVEYLVRAESKLGSG